MRSPSGGFATTNGESDADAPQGGSDGAASASIPVAPVVQPTVAPASSDSPAVERADPEIGSEVNVEAVLAASTRAEATLSALQQAIQQVTAGVSGAREANDLLGHELQRVREMLGASNEQRLMLKNQVVLLEQQLIEARADGLSEREFLIEEQDKFLMGLLEEHNDVVDRLVREREEAFARLEKLMRQMSEPPRRSTHPGLGRVSSADATPMVPSVRPSDPGADPELEKLMVERDRSREVLRRLQVQRDEAQQNLKQMQQERDDLRAELAKIAPGRVPTAAKSWSNQDGRRTQPAVPYAVARSTDPSPPNPDMPLGQPFAERATTPPPAETLEAAIVASRPSPPSGVEVTKTDPQASKAPLANAAKPPLKRKPDPTLNPLGGYSVSGEEVASEKVDTPALSRPPRR